QIDDSPGGPSYRVEFRLGGDGPGGRKQVFTFRVTDVSQILIIVGLNDRVQVQPGVSATVQRVTDGSVTPATVRTARVAALDDFFRHLASVLQALDHCDRHDR